MAEPISLPFSSFRIRASEQLLFQPPPNEETRRRPPIIGLVKTTFYDSTSQNEFRRAAGPMDRFETYVSRLFLFFFSTKKPRRAFS